MACAFTIQVFEDELEGHFCRTIRMTRSAPPKSFAQFCNSLPFVSKCLEF